MEDYSFFEEGFLDTYHGDLLQTNRYLLDEDLEDYGYLTFSNEGNKVFSSILEKVLQSTRVQDLFNKSEQDLTFFRLVGRDNLSLTFLAKAKAPQFQVFPELELEFSEDVNLKEFNIIGQ